MAVRVFGVLLCVLGLSFASRAEAWTRAHVRQAEAELDVRPDGHARVTLSLDVEVRGGWLERLEIVGLDEELVLDEGEPAIVHTAEGASLRPRVVPRDGGFELRLTKDEAPRRGIHRVTLHYDTVLLGRATQALGDGFVRARFELPGWEAGLSSAQIRWLVPRGSRPVADEEVAHEVVREPPVYGREVVRFSRVLVPRATGWSVSVDIPASAFVAGRHSVQPRPAIPERSSRSLATGALLTLAVALLGALARGAARAEVARERALAHSALSARVRRVSRGLLVILSPFAWSYSLPLGLAMLLALVLCYVDRYAPSEEPLPLGHVAPLTRADLTKLRRARLSAWLGRTPLADAGTLLGLLGAGTVLVAINVVPGALDTSGDPWGLGLACALPAWVSSSRFRRPRARDEQLATLLGAAGRCLALSAAFRLVWYVPCEGAPRSPRLRIVPSARSAGILRIEAVAVSSRDRAPLALVITTEAETRADRLLTRELPSATRHLSEGGLRAVHVFDIDELGASVERVLSTLARGSQAALERQLESAALPVL